MAQVTVICPNCSARYTIDRSKLGRAALCNKCNERFVLEEDPEETARRTALPKMGFRQQAENLENTQWFDTSDSGEAPSEATEEFKVGRETRSLEVVRGTNPGQRYELVRRQVRLGRGRECQIVVDDDYASRVHAQLVEKHDTYYLEDLNSKNGTFLNDKPVATQVPLKHEDSIQISNTVFVYRCSSPLVREKQGDSGSSLLCSIDAAGSSDVIVRANPERTLKAILRITEALGSTLDLEDVLSKVLGGLFEIFPQADRGLVLLKEHGQLEPKAVKQRGERKGSIQYSRTIVDKAMNERKAILSEDLLRDEEIPLTASVAQLEISSIMCVPLLAQDKEPLGVIQLDTQDRRRKFDADDMQILANLASQASVSVEYAQLHKEAIKHTQIEKELDFARVVQHSFLPKTTPELAGYDFWAYYQAAGQVGGDFYDFLRLPNGSQAVLIGDVAGKGVPAALMMAKMSAMCKVALLSHPDDVGAAMAFLNRDVCDAGLEFGLVTLVLSVIDPSCHEIHVANAGHISPMFLRKDRNIDETVGTDARGFPLGFDHQTEYPTDRTLVAPGESVVLFSDGISEAMNADNELYSTDRIRRKLAAMTTAGPEEFGRALLDDVSQYTAGGKQHDDMTIVVFRRNPPQPGRS